MIEAYGEFFFNLMAQLALDAIGLLGIFLVRMYIGG